jgi:hypothetical protein
MNCIYGCEEDIAYYFCKIHGAHKENIMAQTVVVKVKVEELSKYGFKANGKYVGLSKQLSDTDKARIVPGAEFEAEYYVADSGKEYLNKITSLVANSQPDTKVTDTERAKKFTPKFTKKEDNSMSKEEWASKDLRISRQGAIQAAVIALAPVVSLELLPEEAVKLATAMLGFVNSK